jgi:cyclic pyranopterin phosphate synthase
MISAIAKTTTTTRLCRHAKTVCQRSGVVRNHTPGKRSVIHERSYSCCSKHDSGPRQQLHRVVTSRWYSSSGFVLDQKKSGEEHHSFFREQMMELEREQRRFIPIDGDENNPSVSGAKDDIDFNHHKASSTTSSHELEDQLRDWTTEQVQVFGETLMDHDDTGSEIPVAKSNSNDIDLEARLEEREDRFEFTPADKAAWGKPPPNPETMQQIITRVAIERRRELEYTESAAETMSSAKPKTAEETTPLKETQQPSVDKHHESFSHVSEDGEGVHMVDVGHKAVSTRTAHARSEVWLPPDVLEAFLPNGGDEKSSELVGPKGPIFATAKIAGIVAAKKTSDLIPLCHPLPLDQVQLDIQLLPTHDRSAGGTVVIDCTCKVTHKTGVEMEALTGATIAALTIYDMTKAVSHNIRIQDTRLVGKTGGKRTVLDGIEGKAQDP